MHILSRTFSLEETTSGISSGVAGSFLALPHVARVLMLFRKSRKPFNKKPPEVFPRVSNWVQGLDLNQRPSGYEPDELPGCSTLQQKGGGTSSPGLVLSTPFSVFSEFALATPARSRCVGRLCRRIDSPSVLPQSSQPINNQRSIHRSQGGPSADLCVARYIRSPST